MDYLYVVTVNFDSSREFVDEVNKWAFTQFNCEGRLDYDLDEEMVDEILGKDAYCGGDIPEGVLAKIEESQNESSALRYFWLSKEGAEKFAAFLKKEGIEGELTQEEQRDWNQSWRDAFKEIVVSPELRVIPSWEKVKKSSNELFIYPGMGFGTGNHETTFLCLKIFESIQDSFKEDEDCLDFGCGSGILGIAAIKKSKLRVDFVDIDPDALDNCVMNLEHNDFHEYKAGHSLILRDRFKGDKTYALVFANILENVLIEEKELLVGALEEGAHLIVSGLLKDQKDTILNEYRNLTCLKVEEKGGWIAIHFQR